MKCCVLLNDMNSVCISNFALLFLCITLFYHFYVVRDIFTGNYMVSCVTATVS
jgi:hypothetical protein